MYTYFVLRSFTFELELTRIHMYTYTCIHTHTYTHIHTHTLFCAVLRLSLSSRIVYIYLCIYTYIHICTYTHIHIYTHFVLRSFTFELELTSFRKRRVKFVLLTEILNSQLAPQSTL